MEKPNTFFRGSELPRLLVLLVILIGGMVLLWQWVYFKKEPFDPEPQVTAPVEPVVPDKSLEFESVKDKTEIRKLDMAAYRKLVEKTESVRPAALDKKARRDIFLSQLWDGPERYRGVPLHILGSARRVMSYESKYAKSGRLYEAWIFTADSQNHPYVCVFEDVPKGFPIGNDLSERVIFNGYFLKLMKYQAVDAARAAPVLIGRIGWKRPVTPTVDPMRDPLSWMLVGLGLMFLASFYRWMTGLRRSLSTLNAPASLRERPTDVISPDELNAWLDHVPKHEALPPDEADAFR